MKNKLTLVLAAITALSFGPALEIANAKSYGSRSSGGSFRSSSKSYSSKSYSSKKSYGKKTTSSNKAPSNKAPSAKAKAVQKSKAEQARHKAAVEKGRAFPTRQAATADFKAKNASKYTSSYATKPDKRPTHIPETYKDPKTGNTYNVTYNQDRGGYGYYSGGGPGLGTFIMYDMMSDAIMMNTMMQRQGYYVGSPPVVHHTSSGVVLFWIFVGLVVIIVLGIVIAHNS